jgi:hypothetical protein
MISLDWRLMNKGHGTKFLALGNMNISDALEQFLNEKKQKVSKKTFSHYSFAIGYLEDFLVRYAHDLEISEIDKINAPVEKLPDYFGEFLGYFVPRKIHPSETEAKQIGCAIRQLLKWLQKNNLVSVSVYDDEIAETAKSLGPAMRATDLMNDYGHFMLCNAITDCEEAQFVIDKIGIESLNLSSFMDNAEYHSVKTHPEALRLLKEGWNFSGVLGENDKQLYVKEVWNMYP